jgi:hypothetical protein
MKRHYARLQREGRIRPHRTSAAEIAGLFAVVERDLTGVAIEALSADRRCRRKRNRADYVGVGYVSNTEAKYLLVEATRFAENTRDWIRKHHSALMPI